MHKPALAKRAVGTGRGNSLLLSQAMRSLHLLLALLAMPSWAQVSIDRPLQLTGPDGAQRQVLGLPPSTEGSAALSATVEGNGQHRLASATTNGGVWHADLPTLTGSLTAGTNILVATPSPSPNNVLLEVNDQPGAPVLVAPGIFLAGDAYPEGTLLSLVYDGSSFHVMNGHANARKPCPSDMIAVNGDYCIEPTERPASNFFDASLACISADRRLCSWGEFVGACLFATQLGLVGMTGNWEWTRDSANEVGVVRMGFQSSCQTASTRVATETTLPIVSRCCYSR